MTHANRGKSLQLLIDSANAQYAARGEAVVQFVSTPTTVVTDQRGTKVVRRKSTVDYVGTVAPAIPVAFDAKQTARPNWPLDSLEDHQFEFLRDWSRCRGMAFLIVEFTTERRVFLLQFAELERYVLRAFMGGRKSISLAEFEADGLEIRLGAGGVVLDYASVVRGLAA